MSFKYFFQIVTFMVCHLCAFAYAEGEQNLNETQSQAVVFAPIEDIKNFGFDIIYSNELSTPGLINPRLCRIRIPAYSHYPISSETFLQGTNYSGTLTTQVTENLKGVSITLKGQAENSSQNIEVVADCVQDPNGVFRYLYPFEAHAPEAFEAEDVSAIIEELKAMLKEKFSIYEK